MDNLTAHVRDVRTKGVPTPQVEMVIETGQYPANALLTIQEALLWIGLDYHIIHMRERHTLSIWIPITEEGE